MEEAKWKVTSTIYGKFLYKRTEDLVASIFQPIGKPAYWRVFYPKRSITLGNGGRDVVVKSLDIAGGTCPSTQLAFQQVNTMFPSLLRTYRGG